jgi:hypothetical protein
VHVQSRDSLDAVIKAIGRQQVIDLRTEQPSLEEIFLAYYSAPEAEEGVDAADP